MSARAARKSGLGKGIGALLSENSVAAGNGESVMMISIDDIKPNKDQPRTNFNEEKLEELAESIREHGVIQPLIVRKSGKGYELVAGERRWRASRMAELKEVPCIVRELTEEENVLIAMIENLQREDLDPIEEAYGLERMMKVYGMTQEQVAKSVSKSRPHISNSIRLLKLPDTIKSMLSKGEITTGHAKALLSVKDETRMQNLAVRIVENGLSVREAEKLAAANTDVKRPKREKTVKDPNTARAEAQLKEIYGTKAVIDRRGDRGTIKFDFYSTEELNRLLDLLIAE